MSDTKRTLALLAAAFAGLLFVTVVVEATPHRPVPVGVTPAPIPAPCPTGGARC